MATTALQVFAYLVTWTLFPIGFVTCFLRVYVCTYVTRRFRPEDYTSLAVGVCMVGCLGLFQVALSLGCGGPLPNKCNYFEPSGTLLKYSYVMAVYYCAMHALIKVAFLIYCLRSSSNRRFRLWVGVGFGLNIGLLINLMMIGFQCLPVSAALTIQGRLTGQCVNQHFSLVAPAVINVLLDFYVFFLPIPVLAKLQMPLRKKIAVISVFAFGGASVIMGGMRFHTLLALLSYTKTSQGFGETIIVIAFELNLAVIAVNLPAMRSLWVANSNDRKTQAGYTEKTKTTGLGNSTIMKTHDLSQISRPIRREPLLEKHSSFTDVGISGPTSSGGTPAGRHTPIPEYKEEPRDVV